MKLALSTVWKEGMVSLQSSDMILALDTGDQFSEVTFFFFMEASMRDWQYDAVTSLKEASYMCLFLENEIHSPEQIVPMLLTPPDL